MLQNKIIPALALVSIASIGLIAYANFLYNSFHFDDIPQIVNNPSIKNLWDSSAIWVHWPTRFVTNFTFALNYHWGGLNVYGYHVLNTY